jgi:hypothetical protein
LRQSEGQPPVADGLADEECPLGFGVAFAVLGTGAPFARSS